MALKKHQIAATLLASLAINSPAIADIVIISQHEPSINNDVIDEKVEPRHVSDSLNTVDFTDLPLSFVVNTIKSDDWEVEYLNGTENAVVTWKGTNKNWQDIVKFVTIDHEMHADINHPMKRIIISRTSNIIEPKPRTNKAVEETADQMMTCMAIGCEKPTISIEKLAIDNSWFSPEGIDEPIAATSEVEPQTNDSVVEKPIFDANSKAADQSIVEVDELKLKEKAFDLALERKFPSGAVRSDA